MPASILFHSQTHSAPPPIESPAHPAAVSLDDRLHEVESHLIAWALKVSHGNKSKAAELLQIKRSTLGDRIRKLGLDHLGSEE
jgi:DNA-binding NtrC family response regulator